MDPAAEDAPPALPEPKPEPEATGSQQAPADSSEDEEYNQRNFGIFQALPVDGEPDWLLEEPDSAEEYLRRVRYEASHCPRVVRVEPAPGSSPTDAARQKQLPQPGAIAEGPDWAKPNRSWVAAFVADFQALRLQVAKAYEQGDFAANAVPHVNDEDAWERACFGAAAQQEAQAHSKAAAGAAAGQAAAGAEVTQLAPGICSKLMALEQPDVISLFLRHAQQLEEACPDGLPLLRAQWLFALAARLEKPCHAEVGAAFRGVLRHCCKLRARLASPDDPLLPALNVLIVTAGAYFSQDQELCSAAGVDACDLL